MINREGEREPKKSGGEIECRSSSINQLEANESKPTQKKTSEYRYRDFRYENNEEMTA